MPRNWIDYPQHPRAWIGVGILLGVLLVLLALVSRPSHFQNGWVLDHAEIQALESQTRFTPKEVVLPHVWDAEQEPLHGSFRYRLPWPAAAHVLSDASGSDDQEGLAILIPRVGARFQVRLDGRIVHSAYWDTPGYVDTGVVPHWIPLPSDLDLTTPHVLEVDVQGVPLRKSGLGIVTVAKASEVRERYDRIYWWQVYLTWMVAACSGMLSLLSGLVWWVGRERLFACMSVASLAWMVRLTLTSVVHPQFSFEVWFFFHKLSFTVYCGFLYLFLWELFRLQQHKVRAMVWWLLWISPLWIALILWTGNYDAYRIWTGLFAVISVGSLGLMMHRAKWGLDPNQRLMVVVSLVTLITGVRDFLVVQFGVLGDADLRWMTPGSLVFMLTLSLVLVQRMSRYVAQIRKLNNDLTIKVQDREHELLVAFEQIKEVEKQKTLIGERARLTRDMHDGLGSQLVQTLNAVRSGVPVPMPQIEQMLGHALEELRMTLDSMEPMEGDLPTILGTLRRRISPALDAAGIELEWAVDEVPPLLDAQGKPLEAKAVMQIFRCLQEVFANVIKHAEASSVRVETGLTAEGVVLSITDNGLGMRRTQRDGGRGLDNIRLRAQSIAARVEWLSAGPGTQVKFVFAQHAAMQRKPSAPMG